MGGVAGACALCKAAIQFPEMTSWGLLRSQVLSWCPGRGPGAAPCGVHVAGPLAEVDGNKG